MAHFVRAQTTVGNLETSKFSLGQEQDYLLKQVSSMK